MSDSQPDGGPDVVLQASGLRPRSLAVGLAAAAVAAAAGLTIGPVDIAAHRVALQLLDGLPGLTLLRALLGLVTFDGEIVIDGLSDRRRSARARKVAYVPQTPVIPPGMLVADYVLLGRTPHRGVFAAETANDRRIAAEVLARLDLGGFGERTVQSLSGGERQRAVMGRALAQQADVLLLDEPTTALDLGHQQDVLELIDALRRERRLTVIATLHDLTLAARYGDRIAILARGRVAETGPPAEVLTVQNIAQHFGASVRIVDDPEGPVIVPTTAASAQNGDQP